MRVHQAERHVRRGLLVLALLAGALLPSLGATLEYDLEIPAHDSISYELDLPVHHAGRLAMELTWDCRRILTVRLDPPGAGSVAMRRSSPSPLRFSTDVVDPGDAPWRLTVYAMPGRESGRGRLVLELPDAAPERPEAPAPLPVAAPAPEPWRERVAKIPADAAPEAVQLVDRVERFRRMVATREGPPDTCRWQQDGLRFLAGARDAVLEDRAAYDYDARELFRSIAANIGEVEAIRRSDDPVLNGPPPGDERERMRWMRRHRDRLRPVEAALDRTLEQVQRGYLDDADVDWVHRMLACVVASERYFAERARLGSAEAVNREIALDQWDRLLAVADALESLARATTPVEGKPIRLGDR